MKKTALIIAIGVILSSCGGNQSEKLNETEDVGVELDTNHIIPAEQLEKQEVTANHKYDNYSYKDLKLVSVDCYEGNECTFQFEYRYKLDWFLDKYSSDEFGKSFIEKYGDGYGDEPYSNIIGKTFRVYYDSKWKELKCKEDEDVGGIVCPQIIDMQIVEIAATEHSHSTVTESIDYEARHYCKICFSEKVESKMYYATDVLDPSGFWLCDDNGGKCIESRMKSILNYEKMHKAENEYKSH